MLRWSNRDAILPYRRIVMSGRCIGSCLCGEVQFEVLGDFERFFLCHCGRCQKDTGSAHAANLFSSTASIKWLSGNDKIMTFRVPSTRHEKSFCSECGSALPGIQMNGALLVVPAGSLDSAFATRPNAHILSRAGRIGTCAWRMFQDLMSCPAHHLAVDDVACWPLAVDPRRLPSRRVDERTADCIYAT